MSWEDIVKTPDVAGTVGAVLGWLSAPGKTLKDQAFNLGAGLAAAMYLAPFLAERFGWESPTGRIAFAFLVGLGGMNLLAKVISAFKAFDWSALLTKGKP
jgi:hypothetical protein